MSVTVQQNVSMKHRHRTVTRRRSHKPSPFRIRSNKKTKGKTCSRCDQPPSSGHLYCAKCHAAYMREWRKTHKMTDEQRLRDNCRSYANVYLRRGMLTKVPCEKCGSPKSQMHHPDYSKPLEIIWLCRPCHLALHRALDRAAEIAKRSKHKEALAALAAKHTPIKTRRVA